MTVTRDVVWNEGQVVEIHPGLEVRVREISYRRARNHVFLVQRVVKKVQSRHPEVKEWTATTTLQFVADDLDILVEELSGGFLGLVRDATGLDGDALAAIEDWPLSSIFKLTGAILDAQRPAVEAFFDLRGLAKSLPGRVPDKRRNGTPQTIPPE